LRGVVRGALALVSTQKGLWWPVGPRPRHVRFRSSSRSRRSSRRRTSRPGALQGLFGDQCGLPVLLSLQADPQLVSRFGAGQERVQTALEPGLDLSQLALEVSAASTLAPERSSVQRRRKPPAG
jgi:hypothetical protein